MRTASSRSVRPTCVNTPEQFTPAWSPAAVDAGALWAASGAQWLTALGVAVPTDVVRSVVGVVDYLDGHGAGLSSTTAARGVGLLAERAALLDLQPSGRTSCGGATRLIECADGWIAASLARPDDLASIPAWMGVEVVHGVGAGGEAHWSVVERAARDRTCRDVVEQGIALGLACASLDEQSDGRPVLVAARGDAESRSLDGAVVVNLASLWAGPLAADCLARLGARVINVESTARPDGARHTPAFFASLHGRSESVALEMHTERGRDQLHRLLGAVDVVIDGSRPRALRQMGIDVDELVATGPKVFMAITGHGRERPHGSRIGLGDDAAAAGGLVGRLGGIPTFIADAVADPLAGLTAAATIVQLLQSRGRWVADVALSRVAASVSGQSCDAADPAPLPRETPDRPRARLDPGRPLPFGRDTRAVLAEFGIAS
jgi:CoA-transferase family III